MSFLGNYFINHFIEFFALISIFVLIVRDKNFERKTRGLIFALIVTVLLFSFYDYLDSTISQITNCSLSLIKLRRLASSISYCLKPIIFMLAIYLLFSQSKKMMFYLAIPALINVFLSLASYYTGWISYINDNNLWVSGPLRFMIFTISGFYYLVLLIFLISSWKKQTTSSKTALFFLFISILTSVLVDTFTTLHTLSLTITVVFLMYYLFIYTQKSQEVIDYQTHKIEEQTNNLLSSQIHPHFIYNTLNIIYSLCHTNPKLAADTILNFSSYLRTNLELSTTTDLIDINKEIEQTKLYSNIEQLRFPDLKVIYDINDNNYNVPFLIIQPMVENAIRHGVRGKKDGEVIISLYQDKHTIKNSFHIITIKDNGTGKSIANPHLGKHKSVGISNVKYRVENMVNGTFDIDFTPSGTTVTIKIPF